MRALLLTEKQRLEFGDAGHRRQAGRLGSQHVERPREKVAIVDGRQVESAAVVDAISAEHREFDDVSRQLSVEGEKRAIASRLI